MYEIKDRWTSRVLYKSDSAATIKEALLEAVAAKADLSGAYLRSADLRSADLSGAYLRSADLRSADLRSADLRSADLSGADLSGAYLSGADLSGAYLSGAYLRSAYLSGAKGLLPYQSQPLLMLLHQPGKLRFHKVVTKDYGSPTSSNYKPTLTYQVGTKLAVPNAETDTSVDCGAGINVAPIDWLIKEYGIQNKANRDKYRLIEIECTANDIACIPTSGGGKFRLHRGKVVRELQWDEVGFTAEYDAECECIRAEIEAKKAAK